MSSDKQPHAFRWLRVRLWEVLVFTSLVAALFAVGRWVRTAGPEFPGARQVSLTFAKKQIADGNVESMTMHSVGDVVVGYAGLSRAVMTSDSQESTVRTYKIALRQSDESFADVCELLQIQDVPYVLSRADPGFTWKYPLIGSAVLLLGAAVYLWFKNSPRRDRAPLGGEIMQLVAIFLLFSGCSPQSPDADQNSGETVRSTSQETDAPPHDRRKIITNSIGMSLTRIPAGEFQMGSREKDPGAREDEMPRHLVRVTKPFYLGTYEVTQAQFEGLMKTNPSSFTRAGLLKEEPPEIDAAKLPVDNVTWYAAIEFCHRLSNLPEEKKAGRVYRLPTEAEWEYACRAETTTIFHFGDSASSEQANFNGKHPFGDAEAGPFLNRTHMIGSYQPNTFGLYDMHGNLHEWCLDRFERDYYHDSPADDPHGPKTGSYRVIRGGDWYSDGRDCRSAFRYADVPEGRFYALGMRVVCELTSEGAMLHPIVAAAGKVAEEQTDRGAIASAAKPNPTAGEDWPKWRGPRGDGTWNAPPLPEAWPEDGLHRAWRADIGGGYGGIAISGGRVYLMDREREPEDRERVLCFDGVSGELLWSHPYAVSYEGVSYDNGPRATPTVFEGHVYTFGAVGQLLCLTVDRGDVVWSQDLVTDFGAQVPIWGLSASPVVVEDLIIVHPGGEREACYIAFDRKTGEERWRSVADAAGYATPLLIEHAGAQQLVCWTPTNVRGLDPATGKLLWTVPFEVNYGTAISKPIFQEGLVLVSGYYEGSLAIRLGDNPGGAEIAWHERRNLRGLMAQPLYRDGHAYLLDKRHGLTCLEMATGKKIWDDDNRMTPKGRNPQATMVWLGDEDRAIALNSDGDLILMRLTPDGYSEQSRSNIIGRTWAHPAYAGNCVYARSDSEIVCFSLVEAAAD
jgi:formylglycine-generating enzyme required for sulfatase activity